MPSLPGGSYIMNRFIRKHFTLRYPDLPCLHVGKKNSTVYLPMEVCEIVEGQRTFHRLTETQKSDMIRHTAMSPSERFRKIHEIVSLLKYVSLN